MKPDTAWLDANVVLRFVTREPVEQASASARLFEAGQRGEVRLLLHPAVVAEVVYVLEGHYGYAPRTTRDVISLLLETESFTCIDSDAVRAALELRTRHRVDFVDAFLSALAHARSESVASFDSDFHRLPATVRVPT